MRLHRLIALPLAAVAILVAAFQAASARLLIEIDKTTQRMVVSRDGERLHVWPVSTGLRSYATPSGQFTPFRMERDHYSREWDDAPMPHSIFFTRDGHAIHGTTHVRQIGRPASHGCVRLEPENARMLFEMVRREGMGNTRVVLLGDTPDPRSPALARPPRYDERPRYEERPRYDEPRRYGNRPGPIERPDYGPRPRTDQAPGSPQWPEAGGRPNYEPRPPQERAPYPPRAVERSRPDEPLYRERPNPEPAPRFDEQLPRERAAPRYGERPPFDERPMYGETPGDDVTSSVPSNRGRVYRAEPRSGYWVQHPDGRREFIDRERDASPRPPAGRPPYGWN